MLATSRDWGDWRDSKSRSSRSQQLSEVIEKAAAAMSELQRVSAIAIVLGDDVRTALDELETQWLNAARQKTSLGEAEERYAAVQKVRQSVEATARRHLRL